MVTVKARLAAATGSWSPSRPRTSTQEWAMAQARGGFVGVDRGLATYLVAATEEGTEVARMAASSRSSALSVALQRAASELRTKGAFQEQKEGPCAPRPDPCPGGRPTERLSATGSRVRWSRPTTSCAWRTWRWPTWSENRHLPAIADASWGRFARWSPTRPPGIGTELIVAPRFFPSTKTCSACGWVWSEMGLKDRVFLCPRAAWPSTGTSTPPSTSPPGRTPSVPRHLGPRTPKHGAGSPMPVEGEALAARSWWCNWSRNGRVSCEEAGTGSGSRL